MNIHEYQAKGLLAKFGVATPRGGVAFTPEEAEHAARDLGGPVWVVKSQIHAGGRGAGRFKDDPEGAGGVRLCRSLDRDLHLHQRRRPTSRRNGYSPSTRITSPPVSAATNPPSV